MKIWLSLLGCAAYALLLLVGYALHARFLPVDVVFYSALADAVLAAALLALPLYRVRTFASFSALERLQLLAIWLLAGYAFAISVPTVLDRSLSFYILEKLEQRGGGIRAEAMSRVFTDEYLREHRLVDVRLTEQLESGTIEIVGGCVRLTARGARLARASRWFRLHLLPRQRLLAGEYTDALTDPFRESRAEVDYACTPAATEPDRDGAR
ncbi:MAG: hypothetical protein IT479_02535 [Xanthomonadales bacterium]|nr:hypothetical protein [Xanthomonadales bacterium]MCC6592126.1 hypothetical protein [Xanthomonadales bacterium]MCE7931124.1 hypothetical protein [Xanthomonadales bacterium PRO6]